ncbi:MAG: hypothetical protein DRI73_10130 [Bacteroidetes bacterium]|nr:MAG: hypothetical protein DRI73_10130 [Bacteroidota bacterium]
MKDFNLTNIISPLILSLYVFAEVKAGLTLWKWDNGWIGGGYFEQKKINKILPSILFREKKFAHWIFINVFDNQCVDILENLYESIHIQCSANSAVFKNISTNGFFPYLFKCENCS